MKKMITLVLSLALTVGLLAGCGPAPAPEGDAPNNSQPVVTDAPKDAVFAGGWPYSTVPTGHFNMFVANSIELKFYRELHQLPLATYVATTEEYTPLLAKSWTVSESGDNFAVTLRDDATWLSGDKFTSKDVWTTFMMYRLVGNPVWSYIDAINMLSDYEVEFSVKTPTPLILRYVLRKPMVDYLTYGEYADKAQALLDKGQAEESTEWQALANEFSTFRPDYVNATGPYYLDPAKVTESNIELMKNEKSFLSDVVHFSKVIVYNGDVADLTPLVLNNEIDFLTHQFPAASMETFVGLGYSTLQMPGFEGIAIYFNEEKKPLDTKEVRQAIAYVVDRTRVGELALPGVTQGAKYISGLGDETTEKWVDTAKLIDYPVNHEEAAALLTKVGMTKKDGQWHLADGTQFTLSLQCPSTWSDASTAASEIAQQLSAFGIKTSFDGIESTMRQSNINDGNFEMALSFFGTGQPHPMFAFETPLLISNAAVAKGLSYPMVQETESCGKVDLSAAIAASTAGWDLAAQKEAVGQIVYTVNETVPILPLYTKHAKYVYSDGSRTDWGEDESLYKNSAGDDNFAVIKILNGDLKPAN
ncbi:MAG: ABC transporter substrate-binding protein [Oscillospiraceae bacterium]